MVSIETARLIVRPIGVDDAAGFSCLVGPSPLSVEVIREKLAEFEDLAVQQTLVFIVIVRKSDGVLMGYSAVSRSKDAEIADVDYWMAAEFRGVGVMTEAAPAVMDVAERVLGVSAFEAVINAENAASVAVARRMGMELRATVEKTVNDKSWTELRFGRGG